MSRSRKKTPIFGYTTSTSEAEDKAAWHCQHRQHRAVERVRLQAEGEDYIAGRHHANSNPSTLAKDGKHCWAAGIDTHHMRK